MRGAICRLRCFFFWVERDGHGDFYCLSAHVHACMVVFIVEFDSERAHVAGFYSRKG